MSGLLQRRAARVQLTPKQANIYLWGWQREARFRTAVCGRRFGKTFLLMDELRRAVRVAFERNIDTDNEIWYAAPSLKQAEKNFWKRALRATPEDWIAHVNNSKMTITYQSGHTFRLVGLNDNADNLRGSGLFFFMGDEWADVKPEAWTEVIEPMLSTCDGNALFIGTPKGYNHMYDWYVSGQPGNIEEKKYGFGRAMSWKYTTLDGGNVPSDEIEAKRRTLDPRTFRQEYEAGFETYAGRIYYTFDRRVHAKVCPAFNDMHERPIHIGMDFNLNPMTAVAFVEYVENGRTVSHAFAEFVIPTSNTNEMATELKTRFGKPGFAPGELKVDRVTIYPDPAGAGGSTKAVLGETDISILRRHGFKVYAMTTHPLVRDRINVVNSRIQTDAGDNLLYVDPIACPRLMEALEKHAYKDGTSEPDKTQGFDHINDALGYYCYTRFAHARPRGETVEVMGR